MRKIIDHYRSVVPEKSQPSGPPFSGNSTSLLPFGTVGPCVEIFLSSLNTNDGFYLSHIPVPAGGKDKKKRTAARRPHAGRRWIRDVIKMLKWHHHVASQRIRIFWEPFSYSTNIKCNGKWYLVIRRKNNPLFV